ncbi:MAG: FkbM family methyltransferase [Bacteroidetes bacterium]|nr:FkbM family methyltransferase [Bacteroidota bacterium]
MWNNLKRSLLNQGAYWISWFRLRSLLRTLDRSSLVIDCGANVGDISALFLGTGAHVIAFEPDPTAYDILAKRFQRMPNFTLHRKAVSDHDGHGSLYFHQHRNDSNPLAFTVSSTLLAEKQNVDASQSIPVEVIDLSTYLSTLDSKVDILKMDVEGAEIGILKKMLADGTYEKVALMLVETHETKIPGHDHEVADLRHELVVRGIRNIRLNWI